jgi:hypothetical protein
MNYKLLVLDIDGTLIRSNHSLSQRNIKLIDEARKKGVKVTLASGRNYSNMEHIIKKLNIIEPVVSNDGAYIKEPISNRVYHSLRLEIEALKEILGTLDRLNLTYTMHLDEKTLSNKGLSYLSFIRALGLKAILIGLNEKDNRFTMAHGKIVKALGNEFKAPFKISMFANKPGSKEMSEASRIIIENYSKIVKISYSGGKNFEILPLGMSKAVGIEVLEKSLNIRREEIIAVGDSYNDIEMIKRAGLGIAMGNASDEVKKHADFITDTNDLDGVAKVIEKHILL